MKINRPDYNRYVEKTYKDIKKGIQENKENNTRDKNDTIEISNSFREIQKYIHQMKEAEPNLKRVEQIKSAIDSGTYRVSSKELAEKIVQQIKDQM